jgi:hypothetical protein
LGDREKTLPKPSAGKCPSSFTLYKGSCLPSVGSDLAEEWNWQDTTKHSWSKDTNYFTLAGSGWGRDSAPTDLAAERGNNYQEYLNTPSDCVNEGGKWYGSTGIPKGQSTPEGLCLFRKGIIPKVIAARRLKTESACTAAGFAWEGRWWGSNYCYYKIPKGDQYVPTTEAEKVMQAVKDVVETAGDGLDDAGWLTKNWRTVAVVGGVVFVLLVLK